MTELLTLLYKLLCVTLERWSLLCWKKCCFPKNGYLTCLTCTKNIQVSKRNVFINVSYMLYWWVRFECVVTMDLCSVLHEGQKVPCMLCVELFKGRVALIGSSRF